MLSFKLTLEKCKDRVYLYDTPLLDCSLLPQFQDLRLWLSAGHSFVIRKGNSLTLSSTVASVEQMTEKYKSSGVDQRAG